MAVLDMDEILQSHRQEWQSNSWPDIQSLVSAQLEGRVSVTVKGTGDEQFWALGKVLQERPYTQLQTLRLHWKRLSVAGIVELATAILTGNLSTLKVLTFANSFHKEKCEFGIGEGGFLVLVRALGSGYSRSLKALQIGDFNKSLHNEIFGPEAAMVLAEQLLLGSMPLLEDLRLNGLHSEEGVVAILSGLESGTVSFKRLRLEDCGIEREAALALASILQSRNFSSLEILNLQDNVGRGLGDDGVIILAMAFRSANMNKLQTLWLHNVSMGERGLMELASVLEDGYLPNLKKLYIAGAQHTHFTTEAFITAYMKNRSLAVSIYLSRPSNAAAAEEEPGDSETESREEFDLEEIEKLRAFEVQLEDFRSRNEKFCHI